MFIQLLRWAAAYMVQQGAQRFLLSVFDELVGMMMSAWKWIVLKVEQAKTWMEGFRR